MGEQLTKSPLVFLVTGLTQLLSQNIASTLSVRRKYVTIISQPIKKNGVAHYGMISPKIGLDFD
ncbi:hypothetical protein D5R40_20025 [Okeania hirsuta]|uniref:Uncharacterized protein n=1 Tax=Okeania hirsuta TaxID=1458930 RepID=A0A3N6P7J6_9CYAN|nr:hypothetical protein D4Z78_31210 [Okeania hirsuta]RQH35565.1 hypothetical protein D5R40_20025 [Okeania hirsuta]